MIRSIVVLLDGSPAAESALPVASLLARSARANLHLVLAHEPSLAPAAAAGPWTPEAPDDRGIREREEEYLTAAARICPDTGSTIDCMVQDDSAAESLPSCIRDLAADLVVMAIPGPGSLARPRSRGAAQRLIRTSPAAVLLFHPGEDQSQPQTPSALRAMLAPVDLSQDTGPAIASLCDFAVLTQAYVTLMNVVTPALGVAEADGRTPRRDAADAQAHRWKAQKLLDSLSDQLRARGISAAARAVLGRDVAETILTELARENADLVAMTPRVASAASARLAGGILERVVRGANKPVLVLVQPAAHADA